MRETISQQRPLVASVIHHHHAAELDKMGELLSSLRGAARRVTVDLHNGVTHTHLGRRGLSGEQVLRMLVLKQMTGFSYEQLAFHLEDSSSYRRFCVLGIDGSSPRASTLQANIKRVRPETLEWINRRLVKRAVTLEVEDGAVVRVDSTAVESDIHHPNDSSLLRDGIRELTRLLKKSRALVDVAFSNHNRRAKRRALGISNAKRMKHRVPLYRELLMLGAKTLGYAREALRLLGRSRREAALTLRTKLQRVVELFCRVIDQTQRRVFQGQSVPAKEKVVSMFEPHTDILLKGGRETQYGHKVFVTTGRSGLVLDLTVERGNPADATKSVPLIERITKLLGTTPLQVAFDAGFASQANQAALVDHGVEELAFAKNSALDVMRSVSSPAKHRELQRFRAGIEASISWLKRSFGLGRCTWSGFESFQAYVWSSALSANLLLLVRRATE